MVDGLPPGTSSDARTNWKMGGPDLNTTFPSCNGPCSKLLNSFGTGLIFRDLRKHDAFADVSLKSLASLSYELDRRNFAQANVKRWKNAKVENCRKSMSGWVADTRESSWVMHVYFQGVCLTGMGYLAFLLLCLFFDCTVRAPHEDLFRWRML